MGATTTNPAPTVLVGVGGGIAAYKVAYLVRQFRKAGWTVHVIPTESSTHFVGLTTWEELSENPVSTSVFSMEGPGHVELARRADLIVIAPTTANLLAKLASGMADDLLTTTVMASDAPLVLAPAMHTNMWENRATQANVAQLREWGVAVLDPDAGDLSSGDLGVGRLPEPQAIFDFAIGAYTGVTDATARQSNLPLTGKHVLVTVGGTREELDPVRFIGNRSSGHQGSAIARAALDLGASVTVIAASMDAPLPQHENITVVDAPSSKDMAQAVLSRIDDCDALIMAAAVADFTPKNVAATKIKKTAETTGLTVELERTQDILATVARSASRPRVVVGFGAETGTPEEVLELGSAKARAKAADLLCVNRVGSNLGFGDVPNTLLYFDRDGDLLGETSGTKDQVAADLLSRVEALLEQ